MNKKYDFLLQEYIFFFQNLNIFFIMNIYFSCRIQK
jgi:hypothetical protein